jgi:hypothetical protein
MSKYEKNEKISTLKSIFWEGRIFKLSNNNSKAYSYGKYIHMTNQKKRIKSKIDGDMKSKLKQKNARSLLPDVNPHSWMDWL